METAQRRLNRDQVVDTAMTMANASGRAQPVTLTALAAALDVRIPSLYNHIAGLEDLQQAMAIRGLRQLVSALREAVAGNVGQEALLAMASTYRRFAHENPGVYPLTIDAPESDDEAFFALSQELLQMILLVMGSLGLQGDVALHAFRGFRAVLHGFVALEAAQGFRRPLSRDESFQQLVLTYINGLVPS